MSRTNAGSYFARLFANGLARMRIPKWASPFANGPDSYLGRINVKTKNAEQRSFEFVWSVEQFWRGPPAWN